MKEVFNNDIFDIVIIGGGITGSVTSILLKKLGYKIALIEKTDLNKFKQGESLSPNCKHFFNLINFSFDPDFAIEYYGNTSVWGNSIEINENFIYNPYGSGLSINKTKFEQELISYSNIIGNEIFLETTITDLEFINNSWKLSIKGNNTSKQLKSRLVIFSTGRTPFKIFSSSKLFVDKLLALTIITESDFSKELEHGLYIEAIQNGWLYTNVLPNKKRVITLFTDSDLITTPRINYFKKYLVSTKWYLNYSNCTLNKIDNLCCFDARTSWSNLQCGNLWFKLGDTAYTIDPLSGQGIFKNLEMIKFCVNNISSFMKCDKAILETYCNYNKNNFDKYQLERRNVYNSEQRWHQNEFWQRRQILSDI